MDEQVEIEIKHITPRTLALPERKHVGMYQPKHIQDMYEEDYKTLINEM